MTAFVLGITRYLLMAASVGAVVTLSAQAFPAGDAAASAHRSAKGAVPAKPQAQVPVRWDRLEPGTIERATKTDAPKAPSFPAEIR